jgi:hypothetical protein
MKKLLAAVVVAVSASTAYSLDFNLAGLNASALGAKAAAVPAAPAPAKAEGQVPQDLSYRFQQFKNDIWRLESDTTWLRSDINRLESDARRVEQGGYAGLFSSDLRRMSMDMSRRANEAQRLGMEMKNLLNLAQKDAKLNQLASDIEMDARDLDNRFQFEVINAAQNLEWTVRRIDPKLIGYDAQWTASDLSRNCRDIQWKTRDLRWDAQELVRKTQP